MRHGTRARPTNAPRELVLVAKGEQERVVEVCVALREHQVALVQEARPWCPTPHAVGQGGEGAGRRAEARGGRRGGEGERWGWAGRGAGGQAGERVGRARRPHCTGAQRDLEDVVRVLDVLLGNLGVVRQVLQVCIARQGPGRDPQSDLAAQPTPVTVTDRRAPRAY